MKKVFVSALAIIVFAMMGCNEAPKEVVPYTINHYLDTIGNFVILTTVCNNELLNKVDTLTRKNPRSNTPK